MYFRNIENQLFKETFITLQKLIVLKYRDV